MSCSLDMTKDREQRPHETDAEGEGQGKSVMFSGNTLQAPSSAHQPIGSLNPRCFRVGHEPPSFYLTSTCMSIKNMNLKPRYEM